MNKKTLSGIIGSLTWFAFTINGSLTAFAASASSASTSSDAHELLESIGFELGFSEKEFSQIRTNSIPAELYYYLSAQNLPISDGFTDTVTITMNYNSANFSYWTHSDSAIVSSYNVNDLVTNPYINTFTGSFTLSSAEAISYSGPITSIRFRASIVGNDIHLYTRPSPVISSLLIGPINLTSTASSYISIASHIPGDIDCNGYVNDDDSDLLSRIIVNDPTINVSSAGLVSADINRDGIVTTSDLAILLQVLSGTLDHF